MGAHLFRVRSSLDSSSQWLRRSFIVQLSVRNTTFFLAAFNQSSICITFNLKLMKSLKLRHVVKVVVASERISETASASLRKHAALVERRVFWTSRTLSRRALCVGRRSGPIPSKLELMTASAASVRLARRHSAGL